jgi:hypothetical protein
MLSQQNQEVDTWTLLQLSKIYEDAMCLLIPPKAGADLFTW